MHRVLVRGLVTVFILSLLAACQTEAPPAETAMSAEDQVAERAMAWWQAMIEEDYASAWQYATPGFRQATTAEQFAETRRTGQIKYLEVELTGVTCEERLCEASVDIIYRPAGAPGPLAQAKMKSTNHEKWLLVDGQWWRSVAQ